MTDVLSKFAGELSITALPTVLLAALDARTGAMEAPAGGDEDDPFDLVDVDGLKNPLEALVGNGDGYIRLEVDTADESVDRS